MDTRRIAIYTGRARVVFGLGLLAAPRALAAPLLGSPVPGPGGAALGRIVGAREVALGAGTAIAAGERNGGGSWLSMLAVADAVDALACLAAPGLPRRARVFGVAAAGLAVANLLLAQRVAADELAAG